MLLGKRQLFLYWRVGTADAVLAAAAVRRWQYKLQGEHPALLARLFRRMPSGADEFTYMETYALEGGSASAGIDADLQRVIECEGLAVVQPWLRGARHVELFEAIDD